MSPLATNSIVTNIPANLLAIGDNVIMADVSYGFSSPLRMTLPNVLTFQDTFYLRPRQSTSVTFTP